LEGEYKTIVYARGKRIKSHKGPGTRLGTTNADYRKKVKNQKLPRSFLGTLLDEKATIISITGKETKRKHNKKEGSSYSFNDAENRRGK